MFEFPKLEGYHSRPTPSPAPSDTQNTVLVVDDVFDRLDLTATLLRSAGYQVLTASDGIEAYEVAGREQPDLIVSDVSMPRADGIELCHRVRADKDLCLTPILLVSALRKDTESALAGIRAGADDYLEAPYEPLYLVAKVAHFVERKRAEEALRDSAEHYRLLFESNPFPMWVFDSETLSFLDVNEAAIEHYGYSREEFLRMTIKDLYPPESPPTPAEAVTGISFVGASKHRKKDGGVIEVEITDSPLRFTGRPARLVLAHDVTERKRVESELRQSQERLLQSQKLEAIGRLAGGVAHDFNNLLTVITVYADILLKQQALDEPAKNKIAEVKRAAERAAALTGQLLAFSRRQMLRPVVFDLNETVSNIGKMLQRLIGEDIRLVTVLDENLRNIKADPHQIEQVIMNLAVNARDAMPKGGKLTIETKNAYFDEDFARRNTFVRPGPQVMLAVSDTGKGMDAETQKHIFEPFFTTKEMGKGTGLGLSTVYGIVKQSGGSIWVYSELDHGSTFKIYLPAIEEEVERTGRGEVAMPLPQGTETILVVEDEDGVRELLQEVLKGEGYTVLVASDGEKALRVSTGHEGPLHLLITDVVMPGMSGRQLAERLAGVRAGMKVLYMSGYTDTAIEHGLLEGGIDFLQKPFTAVELARTVRRVLDKPVA
ncbi:MAG: response regulator [Acidobacteriota bacterium]|nr:response regulator [Acidobacteriota bacterium]